MLFLMFTNPKIQIARYACIKNIIGNICKNVNSTASLHSIDKLTV